MAQILSELSEESGDGGEEREGVEQPQEEKCIQRTWISTYPEAK